MNVRQTNLALRIVTGTLAISAVVSLCFGLASPLETAEAPSRSQATLPPKSHPPRLPPISSYAPIFARSLQGVPSGIAAADTPAMAAAQPVESLVPISQLSLVGTIGNSMAMIKGPDGTVGIVEVGEDVNGSPVLAIRKSECDLRVNGKLMTLRMLPTPDDSMIVPTR